MKALMRGKSINMKYKFNESKRNLALYYLHMMKEGRTEFFIIEAFFHRMYKMYKKT